MREEKEKINDLFKRIGEIELIDQEENILFYRFVCKTQKIFNKNDIYPLPQIEFALIYKHYEESILYCFKVGVNDLTVNEMLYIINNANRALEYGKYILDSDNEIDWEYRFDIEHIEIDELKLVIKDFLESIIYMLGLRKSMKNQRIPVANESR